MRGFTSVETLIDDSARRLLGSLPATGLIGALVEFLVFGLKQAWACLFGGALLCLLLLSHLAWPQGAPIARYDALVGAAVLIQLAMLWGRLETWEEARIILIFHIAGTVMEIFKTGVGSWLYPEPSLLRIAGVPLFSGFMYAAVGSYMVRIQRIFDIRFTRFPPLGWTIGLAVLIYANFFTHHFLPDLRLGLFALTAIVFGRTTMHYRVFRFRLRMPLLVAFCLVALFIWFGENIGTWSHAWVYPAQRSGWSLVSWEKLGSWFLLMIISVVLVTIVHRPRGLGAEASDAIDSKPSAANVAASPLPQDL
jgi:uncharacterized membrane protein YoaT (DUF817 family)